jgi:hypothetical protein
MTMTTPRTNAGERTSTISWTRVQAGLWVGKRDDDFAGMIELLAAGGFAASSRLALQVGIFATLNEAKTRLSELDQSEHGLSEHGLSELN